MGWWVGWSDGWVNGWGHVETMWGQRGDNMGTMGMCRPHGDNMETTCGQHEDNVETTWGQIM